jgi:hypothetical protein
VKRLALIIPLLFGGVPSGTSLAQKASVADAAMGVLRIDRLLQDWRCGPPRPSATLWSPIIGWASFVPPRG